MPIDKELLDLAMSHDITPVKPPPLPSDVSSILKEVDAFDERRRRYLMDTYVWGLNSPSPTVRDTLQRRAADEIKSPEERKFLVAKVAEVAKATRWDRRRKEQDQTYAQRFRSRLGKVEMAFVESGARLARNVGRMLKNAVPGQASGGDEARFVHALESAKLSEEPDFAAGEYEDWAMKGARFTAENAPLMLAAAAIPQTSPYITGSVFAAAEYPEQREQFMVEGFGDVSSTFWGGATSAAIGALETIIPNPFARTGIGGKAAAGVAKEVSKVASPLLGKSAKVGKRYVQAGAEALGRYGIETLEETAQAMSEEGIRQLAAGVTPGVEARPRSEILSRGIEAAKETAVGMAPIGLIMGAGDVRMTRQRYQAFRENFKRNKIHKAIIDAAEAGRAPSRREYREWFGGEGPIKLDRQDRLSRTEEAAEQLLEQQRWWFVAHNVAPTDAQWDSWGMPETERSKRLDYLREGYAKEAETELAEEKAATPQPEAVPEPQEAVPGEEGVEPLPEVSALQDVSVAARERIRDEAESNLQIPSEEELVDPPSMPRVSAAPEGETVAEQEAKLGQREDDLLVELEGTGQEIGGRDVVTGIERIWGFPLIESQKLGKGVRGAWYRHPAIGKLAPGEEASVAVAAHEVSHGFDRATNILKVGNKADGKMMRDELRALDYDQDRKTKRFREGFAEFVRAYMTGSTTHLKGVDWRQIAPTFAAHFEKWLSSNPSWAKKVNDSRALVKEYQDAGAAGRVGGQLSKTGYEAERFSPRRFKEWVRNWWDILWWRIKEDGLPAKKFSDDAWQRGYRPSDKLTLYDMLNAFRGTAQSFAASSLERGVFGLVEFAGQSMPKLGPSLKSALAQIKPGEDYKRFIMWAIARHGIESHAKGKDPGFNTEDAKKVVQDYHDPRYEQAADVLTEFNNGLIIMLQQAGVLKAEEAEKILNFYDHYLPLHRAVKRKWHHPPRMRMISTEGVIRGRHGSGFKIIDPIEATISRAYKMYEVAAAQLMYQKLYDTYKETGDMGKWMYDLTPKMKTMRFTLQDIKAQLASAAEEQTPGGAVLMDLILDTMDPSTALVAFRPDLMIRGGVPVIRINTEEGSKLFQLSPDLYESLHAFSSYTMFDPVTRVVGWLNSWHKLGATRGSLRFLISNAFKDVQTFFVQGEKGLKRPFDPVVYASAYVAHVVSEAKGGAGSTLVHLWERMGGPLSTYIGLDQKRLKGAKKRLLRGRKSWWEIGVDIAGTSEVSCRLAEFAQILQKEGWLEKVKKGQTPPVDVLIRAINASHDVTVDFRRMGKYGRIVNQWFPFFNAKLEGTDKMVRTFKKNPVRTLARLLIHRVPLVLLYWWYRHEDDDYKERTGWMDQFYTFTSEKTGESILSIPKPQEWGLVDTAIERMLDLMHQKEPDTVNRWFQSWVGTLNPLGSPGVPWVLGEAYFNYSTFRDREIETKDLQNLEPYARAHEYNSRSVRFVAEFLYEASDGAVNLSPAKMEHIANGMSGNAYRNYVQRGIEDLTTGAETPVDVTKNLFLGSVIRDRDYPKSVDDMYRLYEDLTRMIETNDKLGKKVEVEDRHKAQNLEYLVSFMSKMRKVSEGNDDLKKREYLMFTGMARQILERESLKRYPNPLADISTAPPEYRQAINDHLALKAETMTNPSMEGSSPIEANNARRYMQAMDADATQTATALDLRLRAKGWKDESVVERVKKVFIFLKNQPRQE